MRSSLKRKVIALTGAVILGFTTVVGGQDAVRVEAKTNQPIQVGDNVYANLDNVGTLTISGVGDMWQNIKPNDKDIFYDRYCAIRRGDPLPWFQFHKDEINKVIFEDGVTSVGRQAFCVFEGIDELHHDTYSYNCWDPIGVPSITSVELSNSIKTIEEEAFRALPALDRIEIPGNVEEIKAGAFKDAALKRVTLNEGIKVIEKNAFENTKLTGVNIPSTVETIDTDVFLDSTLQNVTINKGSKVIQKNAFANVAATIYSKDIVIMEGAFGENSTFVCYKGSTAHKYAKRHNIRITRYLSDKPNKAGKPKVSSKDGKLYVECKYIGGADGYQIRYAKNNKMSNATVEDEKKLTVAGLKKGTKYYVQARGYKKVNGRRIYGSWSNKVMVVIKK